MAFSEVHISTSGMKGPPRGESHYEDLFFQMIPIVSWTQGRGSVSVELKII